MLQLKDLLSDALRRGQINREIAALEVIEIFNDLLEEQLPLTRKADIRGVSYRNGQINADCKNNLAVHWLTTHESILIELLTKKNQEIKIVKIKPKLLSF